MTDTADTRDTAGARVDPRAGRHPTSTPDGYRLDDRYTKDAGRVVMSSIQALARLPVEQLRRDRAAGLRTAALLSGYPGSPLGGYDLEVAADEAAARRPAPGPPAPRSTRSSAPPPSWARSWPPRAPTRATTASSASGTARPRAWTAPPTPSGTACSPAPSQHGGVVALVGDDPAAKSSTMPSSSDAALVDLHMPILYPGTPAECLELGLHAVAISRACGLWAAMKIVTPGRRRRRHGRPARPRRRPA